MTVIPYRSARKFAHPRGATGGFRADMDPPKPGEKCQLCGQVMLKPAEDEAVARALKIIELCTRAGLPLLRASELMGTGLSSSELRVLAALPTPDLKISLLRRASAALWNNVIAEQNRAMGFGERDR
jgi:hypothetical protein